MPSFPFLSYFGTPGARNWPRRRSMTFVMPSPQNLMDVPHQPDSEPEANTGNQNIPFLTDRNTSTITRLPTELLMHITGYLAFDRIQYLDQASLNTYQRTQKDLSSVCLVSKQMEAVARQYLYRAVMINNVDVLVYLVRTPDENWALGQHVRRLVFDAPFILEDVRYRKPNVAVLGSGRNFSKIRKMAVDASDFTKYQQTLLRTHRMNETNGWNMPCPTFEKWAWRKECAILGDLHFEILLRSNNLESFCFGMIHPARIHGIWPYLPLFSKVASAMGRGVWSRTVPGFMSKLQQLQLLGDNRNGEGPFSVAFVRSLLEIPNLQVLKCFNDDGMWFRLNPRQRFGIPSPPPSNWQCNKITSIDLQRSRCTPPAIFQICATFPSLEYFSVSVKPGTTASSFSDALVEGFGTRDFLSTGLAKLEHLRELALDLHYIQDVKPVLGEHGVLNLGGLHKLTKLRLPLHFLVELQPGNPPFITDLAVALPPSVQHLTVWADIDSVRYLGRRDVVLFTAVPPPVASLPYHPRQSALDFMESVSGLLGGHFEHLKEVTYCYGDRALDMVCQCNGDTLCDRCEASQFLELHATDDSATRLQILTTTSGSRGVRLCTLQEQFAG